MLVMMWSKENISLLLVEVQSSTSILEFNVVISEKLEINLPQEPGKFDAT